jgi:glycosyltransferase involved in cell wall biosynthesis
MDDTTFYLMKDSGSGKTPLCVGMLVAGAGGWVRQQPMHPAVEALEEGMAQLPQVDVHILSETEKSAGVRQAETKTSFPCLRPPGYNFMIRSASLKRKARDLNPALVHGQGTEKEAAWTAVFSGFPSVITVHGMMGEVSRLACNRHILQYRIAAFLETVAIRKANGVIAVSPHAEKVLGRLNPRVCRIPNAVREEFFQVPPPPHDRIPRVLFSGNLTPAKRPDWFLQAVHILWGEGRKFDATMMVMGDPRHPYYQKIEEHARHTVRGRRIRWLVNQAGVCAEMRKSDILFHPSQLENMSIAIAEGMAAGRCVMAADIEGNLPLLGGERGILFSSKDLGAAIQALGTALSQRARRVETGIRARKMAQSFLPEIVARQTIDFYGKILGKKIRRIKN